MDIQERRTVTKFLKHNYRHFNAASVIDAAQGYVDQLKAGNKMMITLAGAMSTAELGITLAEMIRQDKVHAITCTGANLEEDVFNLVAHNHYARVPHYRDLSPQDEHALWEKGMNRVTDTCIPEEEAMRVLEKHLIDLWKKLDSTQSRMFPYELFYMLLREKNLEASYQIDPRDSWLLAASEKNLPVFVPGWEDSTLGNMFVGNYRKKAYSTLSLVKSGLETMDKLIDWYLENTQKQGVGFFQIGGGIAGDFPICVVPLIRQDMEINCKLWSYFCQISDYTTSYGSYSGAVPNEKITWEMLDINTPKFVIESDATIVAPLIFNYVLTES